MFNKFSNPETFMAGYQDTVAEALSPSNASGDVSVKPHASVASATRSKTVSNKKPTTTSPPLPAKPLGEVTEDDLKGLTRLNETPSVHKKRVQNLMLEYMDMTDYDTAMPLFNLNEAEQNTFLISLTTKLYQMIVNKIDDVDFGDIPNSKGNIRQYSKYKQLRECVETLNNIFIQYKENTQPVQVLDNALSNLENNADIFMAGYAGDIPMIKMTYETTALGVIQGIGFMIATCIEYVKTPRKEGLEITLKKTGIRKVKDHLVYENLIKFNDACRTGDLEKALRPLIKNKVKNFADVLTALHVIIALGVLVAAIIPFVRQLVYFFYASRVRMSTYLDAQADLLEMNATELRNNDTIQTVDDKNRVIARQLKIAKLFHNTADKIAIDSKSSENQATKDLATDKKAYKLDDVNTNPANTVVDGPLF